MVKNNEYLKKKSFLDKIKIIFQFWKGYHLVNI